MLKPKKCSGTKGYACGKSCISIKKVCRKDSLTSQSVQIINNFEQQVKEAPKVRQPNTPKTAAQTVSNFKQLGPIKTSLRYPPVDQLHTDIYKKTPLSKIGLKNVLATKTALKNYSETVSGDIKMFEAGVINDGDSMSAESLQKSVEIINEFLEKAPNLPPDTEIYTGFAKDMSSVLKIDQLKLGSSFSFPSMTSFSTNNKIAAAFNGGGLIRVKNKKAAKSIASFSSMPHENEVLVPKAAKYKLVSTEELLINDKPTTLYNLEELD